MTRSRGLIAAAAVAALVVAGIAAALVIGGRSSDEADADEPRIVQPPGPSPPLRRTRATDDYPTLEPTDVPSVDPPPNLGPSPAQPHAKRAAKRRHSTQFALDQPERTTSPATMTVLASRPPIQ
jgi:hypothetical protein